jgi:hypothetical protein
MKTQLQFQHKYPLYKRRIANGCSVDEVTHPMPQGLPRRQFSRDLFRHFTHFLAYPGSSFSRCLDSKLRIISLSLLALKLPLFPPSGA